MTLTDIHPGPARTVSARVALDPPNAANDARWLTATAWQGGGLVVNRLERVGPGIYRTTTPIPVHGKWKAMLRLHTGNSLEAIPIYLPRDAAIPAAGFRLPERSRARSCRTGGSFNVRQRRTRHGSVCSLT